MDYAERLALKILQSGFGNEVLSIYAGLAEDVEKELLSRGFERISANRGDSFLEDCGILRPVKWVGDSAFALSVDRHVAEVEKSIADAQRSEEIITHATIGQASCPALIDGQLCGGALSATPVCPRCALGKHGVAQVLTCDVCGAQTAVMR